VSPEIPLANADHGVRIAIEVYSRPTTPDRVEPALHSAYEMIAWRSAPGARPRSRRSRAANRSQAERPQIRRADGLAANLLDVAAGDRELARV